MFLPSAIWAFLSWVLTKFDGSNCYIPCMISYQLFLSLPRTASVTRVLTLLPSLTLTTGQAPNFLPPKLAIQMLYKTQQTFHHIIAQPMQQKPQKTTSSDHDYKKYKLGEKLVSHDVESFREIDINEYDLNTFEHYPELEYIDEQVTPLIYCAHFGLKEICRHLLRNSKVDVDMETEGNRQTPLLVACMRGNYEITRLLVLAGAEVNKPNALSQSPLTAIIYRLADEPVSFENTCICLRIADFLIDHGADVNWIVDKGRGYSLLHYFCSVRTKMNAKQKDLNFQIIKFLLQRGADVSQKTLKDQTVENLLQAHCNKQKLLPLILEYKSRQKLNKIPKHNIKKLGDDYFKVTKASIQAGKSQ